MPGTSSAQSNWDVDLGVIYTYEDQFMPQLLATLAASGQGIRSRLILVDNVSERGAEVWRPHFPEVMVLKNTARLGYAENLNRVLAASTARYALLLNTDMYFEPAEQCLARMVQFMDRHPECGLSVCRIYHPDGTYAFPARRLQTWRTVAARRLGLARLFPGELDRYLYRQADLTGQFECEWVSGCFMMVRRETALAIGGLDTGFRKYFEDVDYCLRVAAAGWKVMFNGDTSVIHCEQRASKNLLSRDAWLHLQSNLRFIKKWGLKPAKTVVRQRALAPARVQQPAVAAHQARKAA